MKLLSYEIAKIREPAERLTVKKFNYHRTETDLFLTFKGKTIAKRGQPNTPQAGTWTSLEPGYEVIDGPDLEEIWIRHSGASVH